MLTLPEIIRQYGGAKRPEELTVGAKVLHVSADLSGPAIRLGKITKIEPGDDHKESRVHVRDEHVFCPDPSVHRRVGRTPWFIVVSYFERTAQDHLNEAALEWDRRAAEIRLWQRRLESTK